MKPIPNDKKLYTKVKKDIYIKYPKHSAYRSGLLVKEYKRQYKIKYGNKKEPYSGIKPQKTGLKRWFSEEWRNSRGEVGYKYKKDIYRPTKRITKNTPITFSELTKNEIEKAKNLKYRKGRVDRFRKDVTKNKI